MQFCTKCGNELKVNDAFCAKCGTKCGNLGNQNHQGKSGTRSPPNQHHRPRVPAVETEEGAKAIRAINAEKRAVCVRRKNIALWISGIGLLLTGIFFTIARLTHGDMAMYFLAAAGVTVIAIISYFVISESAWSEYDYYRIPGSKNAAGAHVCIYCGRGGIHRYTVYQTTDQLAECPSCKKHFWSD